MRDDLDVVFAALDERARVEPRLDRYRVVGKGASALDSIPDGWFVSDAIARLAGDGGWWPGEWAFPVVDDIVELVLTGSAARADATVRWLGVGSVWERDWFWTPALRVRSSSAPLFGFSSQALWSSMVFPTETALLEAFLITYDELGLDEHDTVNPFFVEWVTGPPGPHEPEGAERVHVRLVARSKEWTTDHRCWVPSAMPLMSEEQWSPALVATLLGVD